MPNIETRPLFENSTQATHWTCPKGHYAGQAHHLNMTGKCAYCGETRAALVARHEKILAAKSVPAPVARFWDTLAGRYEYELVRRDELKPGDLAVSSHYGLRTVESATQYGTEGQTTEIRWTDTGYGGQPLNERYDSDLLIPRVPQCGAENPDYPGEYRCTYPKGHGKISEPKDDVFGMDHGSPTAGAFWTVAPEESTPRDRHRTQGYKSLREANRAEVEKKNRALADMSTIIADALKEARKGDNRMADVQKILESAEVTQSSYGGERVPEELPTEAGLYEGADGSIWRRSTTGDWDRIGNIGGHYSGGALDHGPYSRLVHEGEAETALAAVRAYAEVTSVAPPFDPEERTTQAGREAAAKREVAEGVLDILKEHGA